jgi:hypothetical protein
VNLVREKFRFSFHSCTPLPRISPRSALPPAPTGNWRPAHALRRDLRPSFRRSKRRVSSGSKFKRFRDSPLEINAVSFGGLKPGWRDESETSTPSILYPSSFASNRVVHDDDLPPPRGKTWKQARIRRITPFLSMNSSLQVISQKPKSRCRIAAAVHGARP